MLEKEVHLYERSGRAVKEIALMLERQDMLSKLTENQCLDEYGYSETMYRLYFLEDWKRLNVRRWRSTWGLTCGAISKMTKKLSPLG